MTPLEIDPYDRRAAPPFSATIAGFIITLAKMGGPPFLVAIIVGLFYLGVQTAKTQAKVEDALPASVYRADRRADSIEQVYRARENEERWVRQDSLDVQTNAKLDLILHFMRRTCRANADCP